jgi:hypothetical protein
MVASGRKRDTCSSKALQPGTSVPCHVRLGLGIKSEPVVVVQEINEVKRMKQEDLEFETSLG